MGRRTGPGTLFTAASPPARAPAAEDAATGRRARPREDVATAPARAVVAPPDVVPPEGERRPDAPAPAAPSRRSPDERPAKGEAPPAPAPSPQPSFSAPLTEALEDLTQLSERFERERRASDDARERASERATQTAELLPVAAAPPVVLSRPAQAAPPPAAAPEAEPGVRIGQVEVVVAAPARPPARAERGASPHLSSRRYLRWA